MSLDTIQHPFNAAFSTFARPTETGRCRHMTLLVTSEVEMSKPVRVRVLIGQD